MAKKARDGEDGKRRARRRDREGERGEAAQRREVRLSSSAREDRRQRHDEAAARRQGRQPRRDVPAPGCRCRRASPSPPTSAPSTTSRRARSPPAIDARDREQRAGSSRRQPARSSAHRRTRCSSRCAPARKFSMPGHDGHDPQPRAERRDRRRAEGADQQRPLRLGLLPPLRADVRQRRARRSRRTTFEHEFEAVEARASGVDARTPSSTRTTLREVVAALQGAWSKARAGKTSRRPRASS